MTSQAHAAPSISGVAAPRTVAAGDRSASPGRWIGGLVGALASLAVTGAGLAFDRLGVTFVAPGAVVAVGLLGVPVGWIVGRAFLPVARTEGWSTAVAGGLAAGWAAPPLGAGMVVLWAAVESGATPEDLVSGAALLLLAVPFSFVAVFATMPAGLLWALVVRLLPDRLFASLAIRGPLARFGSRHLVLLLVGGAIAIGLVRGAPA